MNADDRRFEVLRAIVADFVATNEPVGSKALVERHNLGVSQRHRPQRHGRAGGRGLHRPAAHQRRAGCPPTRATAMFVDRLAPGQAAVVGRAARDPGVPRGRGRPRRRAAPRGAAARPADPAGRRRAVPDAVPRRPVRHLEVVALTPARLLLVVITDTGRVDQRIVDLGDVLADDDVAAAARRCSAARWSGSRSPTASARGRRPAARTAPTACAASLDHASATVLVETLVEHPEERLVLGGTANLTRNVADFAGLAARGARGARGAGGGAAAAGRRAGPGAR